MSFRSSQKHLYIVVIVRLVLPSKNNPMKICLPVLKPETQITFQITNEKPLFHLTNVNVRGVTKAIAWLSGSDGPMKAATY